MPVVRCRRKSEVKMQLQAPFLRLPAEIRTQIYRLALVHDEPLDLWPHTWIEPETCGDIELIDRTRLRGNCLKVRHQKSLHYIRKEMATGLLGTCTQVFNEASGLFWSENLFRFSGRSGWQGLLRFFLTIGPAARARIWKIAVHAPIYMRWPNKDRDKMDMNGKSKNHPKMLMAKIPEERHLDRKAISRVCVLLAQDRTLEEIDFIIPATFRNGDETRFGGYTEDHDAHRTDTRLRLERIAGLDWLKKTVVVEENAYLAVQDGPQQIIDQGWGLICLPGSFIYEKESVTKESIQPIYRKHEVFETRVWQNPLQHLDYLYGIKDLFKEDGPISIHANGGRHQRSPNQNIKLERALQGFGGDNDGEVGSEDDSECAMSMEMESGTYMLCRFSYAKWMIAHERNPGSMLID